LRRKCRPQAPVYEENASTRFDAVDRSSRPQVIPPMFPVSTQLDRRLSTDRLLAASSPAQYLCVVEQAGTDEAAR